MPPACAMDNHFHVIIRIEKDAEKLIKPPEVKKRYEEFYSGKRQIDARSHKCHVLRSHLNDFSYWMWMFLRMSSFRHNNKFKRRGALWQDGFKSVVLEDAKALSTCLKYVELNPVRAKMVSNPMDYQWSSWGVMKFSGIHPYYQRIVDSLRQVYEIGDEHSDDDVFATYSKELRALVNCQSVDEASLISLLSEKIYTCLLKANPKLTRYNRLRLSSRRRGNGLNGMAKRPLALV